MNYDYALRHASRKGKQPYKPQKIAPRDFHATLPPIKQEDTNEDETFQKDLNSAVITNRSNYLNLQRKVNRHRTQTAPAPKRKIGDNKLFDWTIEDIHGYDVKGMKPPSNEEIKRNPNLMRSNAPPTKRTKTSGDTGVFARVDEWMIDDNNNPSPIPPSPSSGIGNPYNITLTSLGSINGSNAASPKSGTSPTKNFASELLKKRGIKTSYSTRRNSNVSNANTEGSIPLGGNGSDGTMSFLQSVYMTNAQPSSTLIQATRGRTAPSTSLESPRTTTSKSGARSLVPISAPVQRVAPNDEEEISKLKTGDDAVAFFSRAGKSTAVKFVYLNRAEVYTTAYDKLNPVEGLSPGQYSKEFRPYDLVVVSEEEVNEEYFMMSASGVVHKLPQQPTEFISLSDWMKESTMFNMLRRIKFFKQFLIYKMFRLWYKIARFLKYNKKRAKLVRGFFLAKATFAPSLMKLHGLSYDLENIAIMDYSNLKRECDIETFREAQKEKRSKESRTFEIKIESMEDILEKLCDSVTARSRVPDMNSTDNIEAYLNGKIPAIEPDETYAAKKSKSMVEAQKEEMERQKALKKAKEEADMLGNFIRVSDYMAVESLVTLAKRTLEFFKITLHEKTNILFLVTLNFDKLANIIFAPSESEILVMFQTNADEIIQAVHQVPRLLYIRRFKIYFDTGPDKIKNMELENSQDVNKQLHVGRVVRNDEVYNEHKAEIEDMLRTDFAAVIQNAKIFESLKVWYQFSKNWNREEYSARKHTVSEFALDLSKVNDATTDLNRMRLIMEIGILFVDSKGLNKTLRPHIEDITKQIKEAISNTLIEMCKRLKADFDARVRTMKERPTKLKDFARWIDNLNKINDMRHQLATAALEVERMYELATKNGVVILSQDAARVDSIKEVHEEFNRCYQQAEEYKANNLAQKINELEENIKDTNTDLMHMNMTLQMGDYVSAHSESGEVLEKLADMQARINEQKKKIETYSEYRQLFGGTVKEWTNMVSVQKVFGLRMQVWKTLDDFTKKTQEWETCDIAKLPVNDVEKYVQETYVLSHKLVREYKREYKIDDEVAKHLEKEVQVWRERMPVIMMIGNKDLKGDHWKKIFQGMNKDLANGGNSYTLRQLQTLGIFHYKDLVTDISTMASGESELEKMLQKIITGWEGMEFTTKPYRNYKNTYILGSVENIVQQLEDHQVLLQTMQASPYIHGVKEKVELWENKLAFISEVLDEWLTCQKNWMYLEYIFSSDDIKRQLHEEAAKFSAVDMDFRDIMTTANSQKSVLKLFEIEFKEMETKQINNKVDDRILDRFIRCNAILEEVEKNLEDFLETKRECFPRFFFLSNDQLLEILSQTREPRAVQQHMAKCFENINKLEFSEEENRKEILGMISGEEEYVPFSYPVRVEGNVEYWLVNIEKMMRQTLHEVMKECLSSYTAKGREEWFAEFPAQCIATVDMIIWTQRVTEALAEIESGKNRNALKDYRDEFIKQIERMVAIVRKSTIKPLFRTLINTLLVIDVHARDVLDRLLHAKCSSTNDFEWTMQLRYYWDQDIDNCAVRQANASFLYGYEYLGNQARLVITPLTDRCFMTCTGALNLFLGAAPQGPAGTGKTESVKDLAKALARQCVVFNCSEGLKVKMMSRMFSGLAQAGAWACFDEFNRIDVEVLSVVAQYMRMIQRAIVERKTHFIFDDRDINLNMNYGVFITMNPGYAGRTELPDNLKALFRPVAMMIPDYALIAEIMLFSEGFDTAKALAQKMVQLFKLSSEQLSKQDHYDFGMRAVKSILVRAGALKRSESNVQEEVVLIRAMRDSNIPKFLENDVQLFQGIIRDLFPEVFIPDLDHGELARAIEFQITDKNLQNLESFNSKIIQLHETLLMRHGVMVVGQAGTGKSVAYKTLMNALTKLSDRSLNLTANEYVKVEARIVNPKAIPMSKLYGEMNELAHEWRDGLIAKIARVAEQDKSKTRHWIVFDGPVDALWVENMNTVLDDNKMLCIPNGERIKIPDTVNLLFEVQDLAVASPATVSRCGMVYIEESHLNGVWRPILASWLKELEKKLPGHNNRLRQLIEKFVTPTLEFIRRNQCEYIPTVNSNLVQSLLTLLDSLLIPEKGIDPKTNMYFPSLDNNRITKEETIDDILDAEEAAAKEEEESKTPRTPKPESSDTITPPIEGDIPVEEIVFETAKPKEQGIPVDIPRLIDLYFIFAYIWSLGGNINDQNRSKFDTLARTLIQDNMNGVLGSKIVMPASGLVYDYYVNIETQEFDAWQNAVSPYRFDENREFFNIVVPTVDTKRFSYLLRQLINVDRNILLTGVSGVGKTVVMNQLLLDTLRGEDPDSKFMSISINMSAQTTSENLQDLLEEKLVVKRKSLCPRSGTKAVIFVDDINMPKSETFGAQPPLELLRQTIDQGGFYDRQKLFFKYVKDSVLVAACAPPGGGRNEITPRLTRHFHVLNYPSLDREQMTYIFTTILDSFFEHYQFAPSVVSMVPHIVKASIEVFEELKKELLPKPSTSHYTFNLRDLAKLFQGIVQVRALQVPDREVLTKLWIHEGARVFRDRLIHDSDIAWFNALQRQMLEQHFQLFWKESNFENTLFGDYMMREDKLYEEIPVTDDKLLALFQDYMMDYNVEKNVDVNLVFFKDAIDHLSRICRILRQPRGNALLVGVGGSGRHSLTRLAAFINNYRINEIEITKNFSHTTFRDALREMLLVAGCDDTPVVFLFSDTQIQQEVYLEDIHNILNTGEIINLFQVEDKERIQSEVSKRIGKFGKFATREVVYRHFVNLCRRNLHIVLCMNPIGDAFRNRLRMFPSLINNCTIDWFNKWPDEALYNVATHTLNDIELFSNNASNTKSGVICEMCVFMHSSVQAYSTQFLNELRRHVYTTPTSYLELINLYSKMLEEQRAQIGLQLERFNGGLKKLSETNQAVGVLQESLKKQKPFLDQAVKDTANLSVELAKDKKEADEVRAVCIKEERECQVIMEETERKSKLCKDELSAAMPAYNAALKAVKNLNADAIYEIKVMRSPPVSVKVVLEAVCILFNKKPNWDESLKLLTDTSFLTKLTKYDRSEVTDAMLKKLKGYIEVPQFTPENVEKASQACKMLCEWVIAMFQFGQAVRKIEPLQLAVDIEENKLKAAKKILESKQASLAEIEDRVSLLEQKLREAEDKKQTLKNEIKITEMRLQRAEQLLDGLSGEKSRWETAVVTLNKDMYNLIGNVLIASGFVAYLGPFNNVYRKQLISAWINKCKEFKIPVDENFYLPTILSDEMKIRDWIMNGLPSDDFSAENAVLVQAGRRWPLMIDPQGQANKWIRSMYKTSNLRVIKANDPSMVNLLESSIRVGLPTLIENLGEVVDPILDPILNKNIVRQAGRLLIRLGDQDIDYNTNFKLFMTTKLANPHYMPEISIKVTIINFTVTLLGLEDQLLADVVRFERIDLEKDKDMLTTQIADGKAQLKATEDKILSLLYKPSEISILDDESLIKALQESKELSGQLTEKIAKAQITAKDIETAREEYRPVATRGSILYFVVSDMSGVDSMYQNSLQFFKSRMFQTTLKNCNVSSENLEKRLIALIQLITEITYNVICRGLFERDKMLFAFLITVQIMRNQETILPDEWSYFLRGTTSKEVAKKTPAPRSGKKEKASESPDKVDWLDDKCWQQLVVLETQVVGFSGLLDSIKKHEANWKIYYESEYNFEQAPVLPDNWDMKLSTWRKVLLVRTLRPEKIIFGIRMLIKDKLGNKFVEYPQAELAQTYNDSSCTTPILFVLSSGADPQSMYDKFVTEKQYTQRLHSLSLGQGQGSKAAMWIQQSIPNGDWVCLQNCHLAVSWMPQLERIVEELGERQDVHPDFRLWLTSMPSDKFPVPVLQTSIKITNEPPKGLLNNIKRSVKENLDEKQYENCTKPREWKKLVFGLIFFHALIQERRKFGSLGWNVPYEWNSSDLDASIKSLKLYLNEQPIVPWEALRYTSGVIHYGGRVTDFWDLRCVESILLKFFNSTFVDKDDFELVTNSRFNPPKVGSLPELKGYINSLPISTFEEPPVFGLHSNANITFQQQESKQLMDTIISIQPRTAASGGGQQSNNDIVIGMASDFLDRLPPQLDTANAHPKTFALTTDNIMNSLGTFLSQEIWQFNKLLTVIKKTLQSLQRAINGLVVMSEDLELMYNCFLYQTVPPVWSRNAYPSRKPLAAWFNDLCERLKFLKGWIVDGPPTVYWLSAFFFPQGFLTGVLQTHARKHRIAIDQLCFKTKVCSKKIKTAPESGVYIKGLFMEGARWDSENACIEESRKGELFTSMPPLWLQPVQIEPVEDVVEESKSKGGKKRRNSKKDEEQKPGHYNCPVYKTAERAGSLSTTGISTNFVITVQLACGKHDMHHWTQRGVALLTMLDT